MSVVSFKCPNCDGELIFDPESQSYKCEYCDGTFSQQELNTQEENSVGDDFGAISDAENDAMMYTCPSCGAEIVTDATTAATFCYYCHNPVILKGRISGDDLPNKIIPFRINKETAVKKFLDFVSQKKYVPKDFFNKQQIETISGVYFPYWQYDTVIHGSIDGRGQKSRSWTSGNMRYTEIKHYDVERDGIATLSYMTENALKKANADLARGVMPYDFKQMKDFNMGYLSGFLAERKDIENEEIESKMQSQAQEHALSLLKDTTSGYTSFGVRSSAFDVASKEWSYCLLPVWTITYKGDDGHIYYYSINGQTGTVCGDLPVDKKKLQQDKWLITLGAAIVGVLGVLAMFVFGGYW